MVVFKAQGLNIFGICVTPEKKQRNLNLGLNICQTLDETKAILTMIN